MSTPSAQPDPTSPTVPPGLIDLHDWDELIFGGFYCLHCTPQDSDDPDENVYWPCPTLRQAGMTDEHAIHIIEQHRAEVMAKVAVRLNDATLDAPPRQGPCEHCRRDLPVWPAPEGVTPKNLCARCWSTYKEAREAGTFVDWNDAFDHATDEQLAEGLSGGAR